MNDDFIKRMKEELIEQKRNVENRLDDMMRNSAGGETELDYTELSFYDNHPAELATDLQIKGIDNALVVHEKELLKDIKQAINKIDSGNYGKCELCGQEIGEERLSVIPYAKLCINCEYDRSLKMQTIAKHDRPVEEMIWDSPMGRKYLNKREDDEYEGIDQLNDLMKYGSADSPQDLGGYHDYDEFFTNEIDKQGIVDDMDQITNDEYKRQLPD